MEDADRLIFSGNTSSSFYNDLNKSVRQYFRDNKLTKYADVRMWVKAASIFITLILIYLAILFGSFSPITLLLLAMFLGISKAMLALNVGHDANHHTFSRHKRVNSILSKSFDLLGSNSYIWDIVHNKVHHTYTNIFHYDTDTDIAPGILRLSPNEKWKPIYRYQHYYGYFLYFFTAFLRVFRLDFNKFLQKDIGPFKNIKHPTKEIVNLLLFKTLYFSIFLVIPYLIIEVKLWQFLIGFFVMMFTEGLLLGTTFQLAHLVNNADFPEPDENNTIASCWAVHQMATTANFCTKNWFITNFTGGLNHQIEHHLFPDYSSIHCTKIAPIVRAIAEEHGVKYQENISLWSALKSHFLFLKKLGTRPIVS